MAIYKVKSAVYLKRNGKYYPSGTELETGKDILQDEINFIDKIEPRKNEEVPKRGASFERKRKKDDTPKPKK